VNNRAGLAELKQNNHFYFHLNYFFQRALGRTRSESFAMAKDAYAEAILENTHLLGDGNYQFNLHNILSYHYLGVLEYWDYQPKKDFRPVLVERQAPKNFDGKITFDVRYYSDDFQILNFTAERSGSRVEFTLEYESAKKYGFSLFDPPKGDVIMKSWTNGIKKGNRTTSWKLSKKEMQKLVSADKVTMIFGLDERAAVLSFDPGQLEGLLE
jgi:hypothetical protein